VFHVIFVAVLHHTITTAINISIDHISTFTHEIFQILPTCASWKMWHKHSPFTSATTTTSTNLTTLAKRWTSAIIATTFGEFNTKAIAIILIAISGDQLREKVEDGGGVLTSLSWHRKLHPHDHTSRIRKQEGVEGTWCQFPSLFHIWRKRGKRRKWWLKILIKEVINLFFFDIHWEITNKQTIGHLSICQTQLLQQQKTQTDHTSAPVEAYLLGEISRIRW
jgi:hypothetical protein